VLSADTAYSYELAKLPHEVHVLGNRHIVWDSACRPLPDALRVSFGLDNIAADVLILGVDQWTFQEIDKRLLFLHLRDAFSGPKIVVNHGSNMVGGCSSEIMRGLVQDNYMVCESAAAMIQWDVDRSCVIPRGLTQAEWPQTDHSRRNVIAFDPHNHPEYHNRKALDALAQRLGIKVTRLGRTRRATSFDSYRAFLASSAIFFNASYAAPNPQAMLEAWHCGLAVVTTDSNGESDYIVNGENGFASHDMDELYAYVEQLLRNPREIRRIGANGRLSAERLFNTERFVAAWDSLLLDAALRFREAATAEPKLSRRR
jgi:hypothetical protein